jgi:hypothetical protein
LFATKIFIQNPSVEKPKIEVAVESYLILSGLCAVVSSIEKQDFIHTLFHLCHQNQSNTF